MKIVVMLIERIFKNWITTVIGVLLGFIGFVAATYNLIPSEMVWHGYPVADTLLRLAGIALVLAGALAKDAHIGINPPTLPSSKNTLPLLFLMLALGMCFPQAVKAQTVTNIPPADGNNIYAIGMNYSVNASPGIAGSLLYARRAIESTDTWAFTNADFLPNTIKPFTVTNNIGAGLAQKVFSFGNVPVYCITGAGVSWTGSNTGFQYNGGCMATIKYKSIMFMPAGRFLKSSVSNGTGYQPIVGLYVGKRW